MEQKLKKALAKFNLKEALELSDELHRLEESGKELSEKEDRLWAKLTEKIEAAK